jgi:hypothetical protein
MAKKDNQGVWTFEPEEEAQIEILARARVRARQLQKSEDEREASEAEANKCELCCKDKRQGEHGRGKCKKKTGAPGWE